MAFAWAGFGVSFGPAVLLSLYWKRLTTAGAFAGMVTGAVVVMVWGNLSGGVFGLYEILPGFVSNLAVAIGVSLTRQPAPEVARSSTGQLPWPASAASICHSYVLRGR